MTICIRLLVLITDLMSRLPGFSLALWLIDQLIEGEEYET